MWLNYAIAFGIGALLERRYQIVDRALEHLPRQVPRELPALPAAPELPAPAAPLQGVLIIKR